MDAVTALGVPGISDQFRSIGSPTLRTVSDDPISQEDAEIIAAVVDHIDPDTPLTDEQLQQVLAVELDPPPTLRAIRTVLAILRMPHVQYRPGEPSAAVLDRMRTMLEDAETNPPPPDYLGNMPY
ncbi:hypothetical protein DFR75_112118 [Nocardia ignorata]|uniref:Uncharacterized protein n=1 Tax=Nocardia ignorata TaxID=145285 RepID=A0A4R6NYZ7_NOCIG|nr:hypothetical protein DFR75_112118 [Nocardia ignorata]